MEIKTRFDIGDVVCLVANNYTNAVLVKVVVIKEIRVGEEGVEYGVSTENKFVHGDSLMELDSAFAAARKRINNIVQKINNPEPIQVMQDDQDDNIPF